jgi:hypothetical protein
MEHDAKRQRTKQPMYLAIIYSRTVVHVCPEDPLYGIKYIGQAVRHVEDPKKLLHRRCLEENSASRRGIHTTGISWAIRVYGEDSIVDNVIDHRFGPREEVQKWADELEDHHIQENGGVLKDQWTRMKQTLNLRRGGKGFTNFETCYAQMAVRFHELKDEMTKYVSTHKTSHVPIRFVTADGYTLGVRLQNFRRGLLCSGHPNISEWKSWFESLPDWNWNAYVHSHNKKVDEFKHEMNVFVELFGHSRPLAKYKSESGYPLGSKVNGIRQGYTFRASEDLKRQLHAFVESLPGWSWNTYESKWEEFKQDLLEFVSTNGHANVPFNCNSSLSRRLVQLRTTGEFLTGPSANERKVFLESLPGWCWNARIKRSQDAWDKFKLELTHFVAREGHADVPVRHESGLGKMVHWVRTGQMVTDHEDAEERREWLESLPGWTWNKHDDSWNLFVSELQAYVEKHGHARPPQSCPIGKKVNKARNGRFGSKRPERAAFLESLPGWKWNARKA